MERLTERQREVLDFIFEHQRKHGWPPTFREIGAQFSICPNGVQCHLDALEKKGYIRRGVNRARAIEIVRKPSRYGDVPASVVGETLNQFGFGEALANVLKECAVIR